jgi:hypothetical protein
MTTPEQYGSLSKLFCWGWGGAEFLDEIQTKILRVFLLIIHSHPNSSALKFLFLQTATTSCVQLQYTVKEKGGIADRKPYPLSYGLRDPYSLKTLKIMPRNLNAIVRS